MYIIKKFGDTSMWNMTADENPLVPVELKLTSQTPTHITASYTPSQGKAYVLEMTGFFSYSSTETIEDVSGSIYEMSVYKNGQLIHVESWSSGYSLEDAKHYDFGKELTYFSGDDIFEGSFAFDNDDGVQGLGGNDRFTGYDDSENSDQFFGGNGTDTSIYRGKLSEYEIARTNDIWDSRANNGTKVSGYDVIDSVKARDGHDELNEVERLQFSDTNLALDTGKGEIAGSAYRIYKAAFDRAPDAGGLGFWIDALDHGASLQSVAAGFISSTEFKNLYGSNVSDRDYVTKLYNNVLDRNPDQGGYDFWLGSLANGATREEILVNFSESKENIANVADLIANGIQYQEWAV